MRYSADMMPNNRLETETSPYLLQHAGNPVDWYPWGEEALALALDQDKPILLSVGYSACHWCHVMAHESFEDVTTAALMNELYINVKVDREERPDIDRIYQTTHQLLTHRPGGWPLTMFIDPEDQRPFFGGTYFPPESRHGMPSFRDLITRAAEFFHEQRNDVRAQGEQLASMLLKLDPPTGDHAIDASPLVDSRVAIAKNFDREWGGIGNAPKFPHPTTLDRLLRHWRASADDEEPDVDALFLVSLTLTRMAEGGIYDHIGGGFCRYAVDRCWQIPHFEKMLYDNGPLLALYAQLALVTGETMFREVAVETANWMLSDMETDDGGFYSSWDADSEGEEGRFYIWTPDEVGQLLTEEEYTVFAPRFGLDTEANFEGHWHLTVRNTVASIADQVGLKEDDVRQTISCARSKLFAARAVRVPPGRDEKQLTSWNALAIRGMAIAGRAFDWQEARNAAGRGIDFIRDNLFFDGRLFASYKDDRARFPAYLDDHAFLLDAILEALQATWCPDQLQFAIELADLMLEHFQDRENGGFFFTANDHEELMHRSKPFADDATPSGNGIAAFSLQRLGFLLGESRYLDAAEKTLKAAWPSVEKYPHGHVSLVTALEEHIEHPEIIIIRGSEPELQQWQTNAAQIYAPRRMVFAIPTDVRNLPGALTDRVPVENNTIAYRCVGSYCSLPMTSWEALSAELVEKAKMKKDD